MCAGTYAASGCKFWDFGDGWCRLRTSAGDDGGVTANSFLAGPKDCVARELCLDQVAYHSGPMVGEKKNEGDFTAAGCRSLCANNPQCQFFDYDNEWCRLRSSSGNGAEPTSNSMGGPVHCFFEKYPPTTTTTTIPDRYKSIGFGQCAFQDGTLKSIGWATSMASAKTSGLPFSLDQCKADCDALKGNCIALAYHNDHCWLFASRAVGESYTKTTSEFPYYECYALIAS